ncbi:hypothetical protein AMTRI_Chr02g255190 [Amborella trichopoda]
MKISFPYKKNQLVVPSSILLEQPIQPLERCGSKRCNAETRLCTVGATYSTVKRPIQPPKCCGSRRCTAEANHCIVGARVFIAGATPCIVEAHPILALLELAFIVGATLCIVGACGFIAKTSLCIAEACG